MGCQLCKEQWERALEVDPEFIFITGWNEWVAMNLNEFNGVSKPPMFVDQFTQEYSRDIEPMRGGHGDDYYYQMVDYIRRFKGASPIPKAGAAARPSRSTASSTTGRTSARNIATTLATPMHRDHPGWGSRRSNTPTPQAATISSRSRSRATTKFIYFYARTREPITPHTDSNWMMLFINTDLNA